MSPQAQQRVRAFTANIIAAQRAKYLEGLSGSGPGVALVNGMLSVDPVDAPARVGATSEVMFPGRVLTGDRVRVVPFVVPTDGLVTDGKWVEPTLRGRSLFASSPPSFTHISAGAAVYVVFTGHVTSSGVNLSEGYWLGSSAYVTAAEIVQLPLDSPPPATFAEVHLTRNQYGGIVTAEVTEATSKVSQLLGVYGQGMPPAFKLRQLTQGVVRDFHDPRDGGHGPHCIFPPFFFPSTLTYSTITV